MTTPAVLLLVPMIVGYTEAVKTQFPAVGKLSPMIALAISALVYAAYHYLPSELFNTIYAAGSAMGIYTAVKTVGTITVNQPNN